MIGLQDGDLAVFRKACADLSALIMDAKMQPIEGNQQLAINSGAVELTIHGLRTHGHPEGANDAATASTASIALCGLLRKHSGAVEAAMEAGFGTVLPACMRSHMVDAETQAAGCMAMFSAAWDNDAVQDVLRGTGCVDVILEAMKAHMSTARVQAMASAALSNMCDSPETEAHLLSQGALAQVVAALESFPQDGSVQEEASRALCNVAYNLENQAALLGAGAVEVVVGAMTTFPANAEIQEIGSCFLGNVTTDNAEAKQGVGPLALGVVLRAIRDHSDTTEVQEEAWRALIGLVQEKENRGLAVAEGALEIANGAMSATDDPGILRFGSLALLQLVKDNAMRQPLVDMGLIQVLKSAMERFPDDTELQEAGDKLAKKLGRAK